MNQLGHGHVVPRADGMRARCGGPGMCVVCDQEQARKDRDSNRPGSVRRTKAELYLAARAVMPAHTQDLTNFIHALDAHISARVTAVLAERDSPTVTARVPTP
jgi:hypothetical protein